MWTKQQEIINYYNLVNNLRLEREIKFQLKMLTNYSFHAQSSKHRVHAQFYNRQRKMISSKLK